MPKISPTYLQLLPLQNRHLPQSSIPLPNPLPTQRHSPLLPVLAQRHGEQRALGRHNQVQRRARDLALEDAAPLLVAEARLRVVEAERVRLQRVLPFRRRGVRARRVVTFDVPEEAERAVGLEVAVEGLEDGVGGEPVEGLGWGDG